MIPYHLLKEIPYGGDYNPEQWPEDVWEEDMRLFHLAGINTVTLNVFSWAAIQPSEEEYDFSKLDKIIDLCTKNNLNICLATSTGAHPAWMAKRHPDILRVDFDGRKHKFGGRHNSCPNSAAYRKYAPRLAHELAKRYKDYKNIFAWHVSNEFGGECYCDQCEAAFRKWLEKKYETLDNLNRAWNTAFWGHTFYDWDEIVAPDMRSEHFAYDHTMFQGITLDYRRFQSDSMLECYELEADAIKEVCPDSYVTTNLMGFHQPLDYFKWAKKMDFISWDNYPSNADSYAKIAMSHDLMRGIKDGEPFALMEQTPSVTNWQPYNALKRPGVMRLWSYQAMAHGADTIMFFQMRRSVGACEKYHGAVIDHVGNENTRVFREVTALGKELGQIKTKVMGSETKSDIAILMDWDNWWGIFYSAGPSVELDYIRELRRYYEVLRNMNYNIDIISGESDFTKYKLIITPVWYMVKGNDDEKMRAFVQNGGSWIATFFSGYVQENDLVTVGGYPGKLRDILGVWVEEEDALPNDVANEFVYHGKKYPARLLCDLMHLEGAAQVDEKGYLKDFYQGMPVISCNNYGDGKAYYVATASDEDFYVDFLSDICHECGISPELEAPCGIEVTSRENDKEKFYFIMNHSDESKEIQFPYDGYDIITGDKFNNGRHAIEPKDVKIIMTESL